MWQCGPAVLALRPPLLQGNKLVFPDVPQCLWDEIGFGFCQSEPSLVLEALWPGLASCFFGEAGTAANQLWLALCTLAALWELWHAFENRPPWHVHQPSNSEQTADPAGIWEEKVR